MTGKCGFVNGVYVVQIDGFPRMRYFFYNARDAIKAYREQFNLKYKRVQWRRAYW